MVPHGHASVTGIALKLAVTSASRFHDFYGRVMQLQPAAKQGYRCGDSIILFEEQARVSQDTPLRAKGFRYMRRCLA